MKSFLKAFAAAFNGVKICLISEINFRIHVVAAIAAAAAGIGLGISNSEWLVVIICTAAVVTAEMFNTAVEKLCNIVQPGIHPGIKQVKDIAASAVLVTAVTSVVCGCIIFIPKIISLVKTF